MAPTFAPPERAVGGAKADVAFSLRVTDATVVSCHAFSPCTQRLAVCPNNEEIHIYEGVDGKLERTKVLVKHTQRVTGMAFAGADKFCSVSEDRTAVVWELDAGGAWIAALVELKAPKAALCIQWAPDFKRFAVGLASRDVAICRYEESVNCWIAVKKIGRGRAAIGTVAWHPQGQFLATGSTDRRCNVYDVNDAMQPPFGEPQLSEDAHAWVNATCFSPSGKLLAFAGQDSTVRVKDLAAGPESKAALVRWKQLPFLQLAFVRDEATIVACGFDCVPVLICFDGSRWMALGNLDVGKTVASVPATSTSKRESFADAQNMFKKANSIKDVARDAASFHTNTITGIQHLGKSRFSTSALDGQVAVWDLTV